MYSQPLTLQSLQGADLVLIVTDHSTVDYQLVADEARLVVDTRGVMRKFSGNARVVGLSGPQESRKVAKPAVERKKAHVPAHAAI